MKKNISIRLTLLVLAVSILLPVNSSVKQLSSNRVAIASPAILSGSPLPLPTPPPILSASGSPLPLPTPPGFSILSASGSPLPLPTPPRLSIAILSGSPLPLPTPPGQVA
jgi:hypothetical protein